MQAAVDFRDDIVNGIIKSVVFGVAVSLIAVFEGYDAQADRRRRVAARRRAPSSTSSLAILALDFVLTVFMFRGRRVNARGTPMNRTTHRPLGRHLRRHRPRRDPVPRAQGRQPDVASARTPGYRLEARFDNIGGLKLRAPVKAAGVVVGRVETIRLDPETYQAVVTLKIDKRLPVHRRHDRVDPDLGPAGRGLHRPRRRRRHRRCSPTADSIAQDAVGGRAGEADRPVPVRQGRGGRASERRAARRCAHGRRRRGDGARSPAARPPRSKVDPFEPMNRAMFEVHEVVDGNVVRPIAQAYVDDVPELLRAGRVQLLQQHRRPLLRRSTACCRASSTRPATTSAA